MWSISKRYKCSIDDLMRWNALASSKLKRGQVLVVAQ
jgi:LysM repeat protein